MREILCFDRVICRGGRATAEDDGGLLDAVTDGVGAYCEFGGGRGGFTDDGAAAEADAVSCMEKVIQSERIVGVEICMTYRI